MSMARGIGARSSTRACVLGLSITFAALAVPLASAGGYSVYVTNETGGTLSVIDGQSLSVTATIDLGKRPRGIHACPSGRRLYIALRGSPMAVPGTDPLTLPAVDTSAGGIGVVDIETGQLVTTWRGVSHPAQLVVSRDGSRLYIASEDTGTAVVLSAETGERLAELEVGAVPTGIAIRPDGAFVYVASEQDHTAAAIDTQVNRVVRRFKVGLRPSAVAFSHDGRHAYITGENDSSLTVVDALRHEPINTVELGPPNLRPTGVAIAPPCGSVWLKAPSPLVVGRAGALPSPDCGSIFVATGRGQSVVRVDADQHSVIASVPVAERPQGIDLSPDGRYLFSANGPSNDVSVIDTRTMTVVKTIEVGESPWGTLVLSNERRPRMRTE